MIGSLAFPVPAALGLFLFAAGGCSRMYMSFQLRKSLVESATERVKTETAYRLLAKAGKVSPWPLYAMYALIPLGIAISFAAFLIDARMHPEGV